jgi:ribose 1,5-bisphosphokinase
MRWRDALRRGGEERERLLGPGRLVLVIGPSGAGKDTVIAQARAACRDDPEIVFPRRMITRTPTAAEDHDTVAIAAFDQAARDGAFALHWEAHGLKYGIPVAIDEAIGAGRTVVCNVSRTIVAAARQRYLNVQSVLVTAPRDILAARLATRARASDGRIADRIDRVAAPREELSADFVIRNVGRPEEAAARFIAIVKNQEFSTLF